MAHLPTPRTPGTNITAKDESGTLGRRPSPIASVDHLGEDGGTVPGPKSLQAGLIEPDKSLLPTPRTPDAMSVSQAPQTPTPFDKAGSTLLDEADDDAILSSWTSENNLSPFPPGFRGLKSPIRLGSKCQAANDTAGQDKEPTAKRKVRSMASAALSRSERAWVDSDSDMEEPTVKRKVQFMESGALSRSKRDDWDDSDSEIEEPATKRKVQVKEPDAHSQPKRKAADDPGSETEEPAAKRKLQVKEPDTHSQPKRKTADDPGSETEKPAVKRYIKPDTYSHLTTAQGYLVCCNGSLQRLKKDMQDAERALGAAWQSLIFDHLDREAEDAVKWNL